jgi:YegS/Rv2252/BmrU family lipid kinase
MSAVSDAPVCLLVNPTAGGGRAARRTRSVLRALEGEGLRVRCAAGRDREHVRDLAAAAAAAGETVATLGGDGIAGAAADGLREVQGSVLGIIPAGRGNDLARVLGIPTDPLAACAVIAHGVGRPMDLGEADGRAFVGIASVGFDSEANRIANLAPAWLGAGVYGYGALRALLRWRPAAFELELYGRGRASVQFTGYSAAFANSRCFGGGMRLAPESLLDDGLLDIVLIAQMARARYAWHLPKVFTGHHLGLRVVQAHRASEAVIAADRPFTMYADGDPIGELPVRLRMLPDAIRVLTPAVRPEAFARAASRERAAPEEPAADARRTPVYERSAPSKASQPLS